MAGSDLFYEMFNRFCCCKKDDKSGKRLENVVRIIGNQHGKVRNNVVQEEKEKACSKI